MITLTIIKILLILDIIFYFAEICYRVITQKDKTISWEADVIGDMVGLIISLLLLIGLIEGW